MNMPDQPETPPVSAPLPRELTSYDLVKALALVIMVADHIGHYFFPQDLWWRAVGRIGFPVWFFLMGYSTRRTIPKEMIIGGVLVTIALVVSGQFLLPVNALFSMAIIRLSIDPLMARALRNYQAFWSMVGLLSFMVLLSMLGFEYGTLGLMFAMYGYMRRHKENIKIEPYMYALFVLAIGFIFILYNVVLMNGKLDAPQYAFMTLGTFGMTILLFFFRPKVYPRLTRSLGFLTPVIQFMGRRTLELYVAHIALFCGLAMYLDPSRFEFLDFQYVAHGLLKYFM
jgi:hypothetical protein